MNPKDLKSLYEKGENIAAILRAEKGIDHNTDEIIEFAYDLQAGKYIEAMNNAKILEHKKHYTAEISRTILSLCKPCSILEAGVGEATTLAGVVNCLKIDVQVFGFDLSWSRVAYAQRWLNKNGIFDTKLCTGNLLNLPFADNSIDVVYTSHSIEPNGGNEEPILKELFRVARKYLILLEPGYELANEEARNRMAFHGYCKNLKNISMYLGFKVLKHELFPFTSNPLNPTAITIINKAHNGATPPYVFACPIHKTALEEIGGMMYSPEGLVVYPILAGIPCLRIENGILASKYKEMLA